MCKCRTGALAARHRNGCARWMRGRGAGLLALLSPHPCASGTMARRTAERGLQVRKRPALLYPRHFLVLPTPEARGLGILHSAFRAPQVAPARIPVRAARAAAPRAV